MSRSSIIGTSCNGQNRLIITANAFRNVARNLGGVLCTVDSTVTFVANLADAASGLVTNLQTRERVWL